MQLGQPTDLTIPRQLVVLMQLPALLVATYLPAQHTTRALTRHPLIHKTRGVAIESVCKEGAGAKGMYAEQIERNFNSLQ